ncbi:MAG: Asp-tRNA(Asn)/Glu-tRNA(Gln) amidotransferase subunit GatA [Pseudomonadota bacterium]|nr:Asp-tRNA(Asn)/Glu-tRNA(Gln) amidotransferase subunit GatA [Pseudomonadota bacterium]
MNELVKLSIAEARDALANRSVSSFELTEAFLKEAKAATQLNAYCSICEEKALVKARSADEDLKKNATKALCGLPIGVKDIFCTNGVTTQAASKILENFVPAYESTVTQKLWAAGAIMIGKLNMDEFAMGSSNETSAYGPAINPWKGSKSDKKLTPGGSSGGSAAAVAANLCLAATGTDTGGSIRQPAAFCGVVGLKPTYGRCSRWGIIAFASSLDQAGPITKTVRDSAIMLSSMAGYDPKDSTSADKSVPDFESFLGESIKGKKIGVPKEYRIEGMPTEIEKLWQEGAKMLHAAGAEIVDISLPNTKYALPAYYVLAPAEASSNLARYDGVRFGKRIKADEFQSIDDMYSATRGEGFGAEVKRRILIGTYVLSAGFYDAYYIKAQKVRTLIQNDFSNAYRDGIDAILTPATPSTAFEIGDQKRKDPLQMYLNDVFTVTVNLAGLPAISLPASIDGNGLPLGLQLIGKPWEEGELLSIAFEFEKQLGFSYLPKKWW